MNPQPRDGMKLGNEVGERRIQRISVVDGDRRAANWEGEIDGRHGQDGALVGDIGLDPWTPTRRQL